MAQRYDAVIMGRETYRVGENFNKTDPYPGLKTYVFSRSMKASPDPAVQLVKGDAAAFVRNLKQSAGGDILPPGINDVRVTISKPSLITSPSHRLAGWSSAIRAVVGDIASPRSRSVCLDSFAPEIAI